MTISLNVKDFDTKHKAKMTALDVLSAPQLENIHGGAKIF